MTVPPKVIFDPDGFQRLQALFVRLGLPVVKIASGFLKCRFTNDDGDLSGHMNLILDMLSIDSNISEITQKNKLLRVKSEIFALLPFSE
jgi:hypothetical protein